MGSFLIKNATVINEGARKVCDVLIRNGIIETIGNQISTPYHCEVIEAKGLFLIPGLIDDQVHFREPGLTHKADIRTESRAAAAGGITSFMEMPNTVPNTLGQVLLQEKYDRAAEVSAVNYSFFMGASNDNLDEVLKTNPKNVCGIKIFMGSSTGNMLVDKRATLEGIFKESPTIIATHCEDEETIKANFARYEQEYGGEIPFQAHPLIRSAEACYKSSSFAVELATKFNTQLHILHISTARELALFRYDLPLAEKRVTAEACVHHLWFSDEDYAAKGSLIKWNPAVKTAHDRAAIHAGVNRNAIDVIATDHAPHTLEEKRANYAKAPSGGPLVQHALLALLDLYHDGIFSLEKIVEKTSHNVATLFRIQNRGFIREGYAADLVLVDLNQVQPAEPVLYKCGWSPFGGHTFKSKVRMTWVNGDAVYRDGIIDENVRGQRLIFDR